MTERVYYVRSRTVVVEMSPLVWASADVRALGSTMQRLSTAHDFVSDSVDRRYNSTVVINGWKEIAKHLGCSLRAAQRWEHQGLPVLRPAGGMRSPVLADSEQLDVWVRDSVYRSRGDLRSLGTVQRTRELRAQVQQARETMRVKVKALKEELAVLESKRQQHARKA